MNRTTCFLSAIVWLAVALAGHAQTNRIVWFTIDGGGGTSTGGVYAVSGTLGQPDAGATLTGGNYSLTGGFWSGLAAVQQPGAPTLFITTAGPNATLSWSPATPGFVLQHTTALSPVDWQDAPSGSTNSNSIPATGAARFYRLRKP